jgi:hypothetical protein
LNGIGLLLETFADGKRFMEVLSDISKLGQPQRNRRQRGRYWKSGSEDRLMTGEGAGLVRNGIGWRRSERHDIRMRKASADNRSSNQ